MIISKYYFGSRVKGLEHPGSDYDSGYILIENPILYTTIVTNVATGKESGDYQLDKFLRTLLNPNALTNEILATLSDLELRNQAIKIVNWYSPFNTPYFYRVYNYGKNSNQPELKTLVNQLYYMLLLQRQRDTNTMILSPTFWKTPETYFERFFEEFAVLYKLQLMPNEETIRVAQNILLQLTEANENINVKESTESFVQRSDMVYDLYLELITKYRERSQE